MISTPGFCNDRVSYSDFNGTTPSWVASGSVIYYAAYVRLRPSKMPTLKCSNNNDLYTTKIGLITADEVVYAGGVFGGSNNSYYLYTGQYYWTMSPSSFANDTAGVFIVDSDGLFSSTHVRSSYGVRPVINLRADVTLTGSGTMTDPYVVS